MIFQLLAFELRYYARQASVQLGAAIYLVLGLLMAQQMVGGERVLLNAPYALTFKQSLMSLGSIFVVTVLCGHAILRDSEAKMEAIVFSTAITKFQFLVSRFTALVLVSLAVFSMGAVGLALGHFAPWIEVDVLGPHSLLPYLWIILVIGLPNTLFCSAVLFGVTALVRRPIVSYVTGVSLYILYMVGSILGNSPLMAQSTYIAPDHMSLASLLDPYGFISFLEQTRYWTVAQKNTSLVALEGSFLFNRMLWFGIGMATFAFVYKAFSFRVGPSKAKGSAQPEAVSMEAARPYAPTVTKPRAFLALGRALFSQVRVEAKTVLLGIPTYVLLLMWAGLLAITLSEQLSMGERGLPFYPVTSLILPLIEEPLAKVGILIVIFFAGELAWAAKSVGFAPIVGATPTHWAIEFGSKLINLAIIIITLLSFNIVAGLAFQLFGGHSDLQLLQYLELFYFIGLPLLLFAVPALAVHSLVSNKYVGMLMALSAPIALRFFNRATGLSSSLLGNWFVPQFHYSDMAGAFHLQAFHCFVLLWGALALALILLVISRSRRVASPQQRRSPGWVIVGVSSCLAVALGSAAKIGAEMSPTDWVRLDGQKKAWNADYEIRYGFLRDVPSPLVTSVVLNVDIYPEQRRYVASGTYIIENPSSQAMTEFWLGVPIQNDRSASVEVIGASQVEADEAYGMYRYVFDRPLVPGDEVAVSFSVDVHKSAFAKMNPENYVLAGASYIEMDKFIPFFGYTSRYEMTDNALRAKYGLADYHEMAPLTRETEQTRDWIDFETTVSTSSEQSAVAIGRLDKQWEEGDRAFFHYVSDTQIPFALAYSSAPYERISESFEGVDIDVFYYKDHAFNVAEMMASAKVSLSYFKANFGPYPYDTFKIAEVPAYSDDFGATAYPNTVFSVENRVFLVDQRSADDANIIRSGVAHEASHIWWGQMLRPADVEGYRLLTEGLAVYSEMVVDAQGKDRTYIQNKLKKPLDLYFQFRGYGDEPEQPMMSVTYQPFVYYFKGAHVMYVLRELLGEETVNEVLSDLIAEHGYPNRPTSHELLDRLYARSSPQVEAELRELFEQVVTYNLMVEDGSISHIEGGGVQVSTSLWIRRYQQNREGINLPIAFNGALEVVFLDADGQRIGDVHEVDIKGERESYVFDVEMCPSSVVIDPRALKLEATSDDNVWTFETEEQG